MNKQLLSVVMLLLAALSIGCDKSDGDSTLYGESWEEKWVVASKTVTVTGDGEPELCYWVKIDDNPVWQICHCQIDGFNYESGYEYELLIQVQKVLEPLQDASSHQYTLLSIVSKQLKDSNVPSLTGKPLAGMSNVE